MQLNFSVLDSDAYSDPVPFWPREPGWVKSKNPDPWSGMNNPDHISQSWETIFCKG